MFATSYDSQGYGGSILIRLETEFGSCFSLHHVGGHHTENATYNRSFFVLVSVIALISSHMTFIETAASAGSTVAAFNRHATIS
jgi:hypothetical protein